MPERWEIKTAQVYTRLLISKSGKRLIKFNRNYNVNRIEQKHKYTMRDPLDLFFPSSHVATCVSPSQKLREHGERLLAISDFREKLQYYN